MIQTVTPISRGYPGGFTLLAAVLGAVLLGSGLAGAQDRTVPVDTTITHTDQVTVKGESIPYEVTTGMMPVYDDDGEPDAALHYTYYRRTDVEDTGRRPLMFSFNGGPGSGSLWMHIGYTSPRMLNIDPEGYPVQPYGVRDNPHSVIDKADIVYVNPVNTGFSRMLDGADRERFFGVREDIGYLADWIDVFVSRNDRWSSPKYLIGESYGTTRVAGLASRLQDSHWMYINGVILVSPTDLGIEVEGPEARGGILKLPYMAATAWYHDQLPDELQRRELEDFLPEVEDFVIEEYLPAVSRGASLDEDRRQDIAEQVAYYSGLSVETVKQHNLVVPTSYYWKDLLREEGYTVGRLDSRYKGIDRQDAGDSRDYSAALTAWNHAFTPAINEYLRSELGFETDLQYNVFGPVHPWQGRGQVNVAEQLRESMAKNPYLNVMVQSGYFDGATDYFMAKYLLWNMDRADRVTDRMRFEGYESGHMMYLREEDLATSNEHIREFIEESVPEEGVPAKY